MSLYNELKRRNVFRVAAAYIVGAWLIIQVSETIFPLFGFNDTPTRIVVIILAIGFPLFLVFSWVFELTPDGLKKEGEIDNSVPASRKSTKRLDRIFLVVLSIAVTYFAFDKFVLDPARDVEIASEAAEQALDEAMLASFGDNSIAVMAFSDLSANKDQEYFSDGIAEEIINLLSQIHNLRVIARSSAFVFKGQNLAASEIAERLNVRFIMEGSVRRSGNRIRITTTMIDARSDTQLWSESFDRDFGDIFAIQDEVANEVVNRLEIQVSGNLPVSDRVDPESYALYLQARHLLNQHENEKTAAADRFLRESLERDPMNIAAWVLFHAVDYAKLYWGHWNKDEARVHTIYAANKILEIDPGNSKARVMLRSLEQDALDTWEGELAAVTFSLKLLPTDKDANLSAAVVLGILGISDRSIEYFEYVLGKDPLCASCLRGYMLTLMALGEYDSAKEVNLRYRTITDGSGTYTLGIIQFLQGDAEVALETIKASKTFPFVILQGEALAYWTLGREDEYETALANLEATLLDEQFDKYIVRPASYLAGVYSWVGRKTDAFAILEDLIDPPRSWGPHRWLTDPLFAPLHEDPRWLVLREKERIAPHQIESYQIDKLFPGPGIVPAD